MSCHHSVEKRIIHIVSMNKSHTLIAPENLESDLLRTFLAVADAGSFTRGAERVFRTQSAASLQIKRLEELLGQAVFKRLPRGVELTLAGERLRAAAQRIVSMLDATVSELRSGSLKGSITVGIPDEYGTTVLPSVLARFAQVNPLVEVAVRCGFSATFPEAVRRGQLDLAVIAVERPGANVRLLASESVYWATSRHHDAHERDPLPVALFDRECWWRDRAIEALERAHRRFRIVYTSESVVGVRAAIATGVAVGVLAESSIDAGLRRLTGREGFPRLSRSALVLRVRKMSPSALVAAMTDAILGAFSAEAGNASKARSSGV